MIKTSLLTLSATLSLAGALTAQTTTPVQNTQIRALPFTISSPGTYVLKSDLTYSGNGNNFNQGAIIINAASGGTVILELKGFTITNAGNNDPTTGGSFTSGISIQSFPGGTPPVVTIRNGTITNFATGIYDVGASDITINRVVFNQNNQGVSLQSVANATVNNCQFNGKNATGGGIPSAGIYDVSSPGGNAFHNNTFNNLVSALSIGMLYPLNPGDPINTTLTIDGCRIAPPPTP
jgi:hypothetical protein